MRRSATGFRTGIALIQSASYWPVTKNSKPNAHESTTKQNQPGHPKRRTAIVERWHDYRCIERSLGYDRTKRQAKTPMLATTPSGEPANNIQKAAAGAEG